MKHHIYITPEGSINWIEKMPEMKKKRVAAMLGWKESDDMYQYAQDIELAKSESICFEDQSKIRGLLGDYLDPHNKPIIKKDRIYPIELDADIHTTHQSRFKRWHDEQWTDWVDISILEYERSIEMGVFETRKVAKIIPKKAEESESQLDMMIEVIAGWDDSYESLESFAKSQLEKFEIKRKPL